MGYFFRSLFFVQYQLSRIFTILYIKFTIIGLKLGGGLGLE